MVFAGLAGQVVTSGQSFGWNLGVVVLSKPFTPSAMLAAVEEQVPVEAVVKLHIFPSAAIPGR